MKHSSNIGQDLIDDLKYLVAKIGGGREGKKRQASTQTKYQISFGFKQCVSKKKQRRCICDILFL